jgi:hypothetical protein
MNIVIESCTAVKLLEARKCNFRCYSPDPTMCESVGEETTDFFFWVNKIINCRYIKPNMFGRLDTNGNSWILEICRL